MPNDVVSRAIDAVCAGDHLTADHAGAVLSEIMEGRADPVQTGAFLIALRAKGETVPELVGLARTMRALADPVSTSRANLVDTAGTGGGPSTFNVSTAAALVAAGAGCAVAKHGNRSSTSKCGSADLLEALGVNIELDPDAVGRCIDEIGFGFMFAPRHHAAMAHVIPARKALGVRTIFNFLGPLTNPAGAEPAAARGRRPPLPGDDRRGAGRPRQRPRPRRRRRGRPRRALDLLADPGDRGRRRAAPRSGSSSPASSAWRRPRWRRWRGVPRSRTPPPCGRCWPASRAPSRPHPAQRRRRDLRRRPRPRPRARGSPRRSPAIDSGAGAESARAADRGNARRRAV